MPSLLNRLTLANWITIARVLLIPVFVAFLLSEVRGGALWAAAIFAFAAATDSLDGYIARRHNQITRFGQIFDPLADKLLVSAALVTLVGLGRLSAWIAIIIIARDFAVSGLRLLALSSGKVVPASWLGKAKTTLQVIAIVLWILQAESGPSDLAVAAMFLALLFTVISGVDYYLKTRFVFDRLVGQRSDG